MNSINKSSQWEFIVNVTRVYRASVITTTTSTITTTTKPNLKHCGFGYVVRN
jgi:hypothetical protein